MADEQDAGETNQATAEVETKAKAMGWVGKEEFRGDPERFIDATEYLRRGEEMLPIVRAENRHLKDELGQTKGQMTALANDLKAARDAIEALKESNSQIALDRAKETRKVLGEQIAKAREDNDVARELELQDSLTAVRSVITEAEKPAAKEQRKEQAAPEQQQLDPSTTQFMRDNPWFGTDKRRTALATGIAQELRADSANAGLMGEAFFNKIKSEVDKIMPFDGSAPRKSKVEGGANGGGGGGGSNGSPRGQSFADLPADAQAACERQSQRVVGKGRAFADVAAWRKHYASQYFAS